MDSTTLITAPPEPQTLQEVIDGLRSLEDEVGQRKKVIRAKGKELIVLRFRQGKMAARAMDMVDESHYGEKLIPTLARNAGIHKRTLYNALKFYQHPQFGGSESALKQWMSEKEEEKSRSLTWSYCRNWARKRLDDGGKTGGEDPKERLKEEINKLEQSAERTESHAMDLAEEVERLHQNGKVSEDVVAEAEGVLAKTHQAIEDARRQAEWMEAPKSSRIQSKKYLEHVRSYYCLVCGAERVDAHHIRARGMGQKDHDVFTIPLCREHHREWHQHGAHSFCDKHQIDPWQVCAFILAKYITGVDLN